MMRDIKKMTAVLNALTIFLLCSLLITLIVNQEDAPPVVVDIVENTRHLSSPHVGHDKTPPMGWSMWNHFQCKTNQKLIEDTVDAFTRLGLGKVGYRSVILEDCWAKRTGADGTIKLDPKRFPDFQGMIERIHDRGLQVVLYNHTTLPCKCQPQTLGHEPILPWHVDYLKYDNCHEDAMPKAEVAYSSMNNPHSRKGWMKFVTFCNRDGPSPSGVVQKTASGDVRDDWDTMLHAADMSNQLAHLAHPRHWNDPGILAVGQGGMTDIEYKTHMSLWCLMKAPLIIGSNDITSMSQESIKILTNPEVIAVNQDRLGVQGRKIKVYGDKEVWAGPLEGGSYVVLLLNRGKEYGSITVLWSDLGFRSKFATVRDLWKRSNFERVVIDKVTSVVPRHGVKMYKVTPKDYEYPDQLQGGS